jgi:cyclopropane fatty-acyl-phospholipid synthase-like methyltransferase
VDDGYGEAYYQDNGQLEDRPALLLYQRLVKRYLGDGPILDVGCGTGHLLRRLSTLGPADGLELSEFSAARARMTSPTSRVVTAIADLPRTDYSRVTAIHVVEHIPDSELRVLLRRLLEVTSRRARMLVVTPDTSGRGAALHGQRWNALRDPTHCNLKAHRDWQTFFQAEGWQVAREGSDGLWDFPYSYGFLPADVLRHGLPMAAQFLSGRLILKPGTGESSLLVLEKTADALQSQETEV